jgi:hypothetical protein
MRVTETEWQNIQAKRGKAAPVATEVAKPKRVIRQSRKKPNKTEARFEIDYLKLWMATGFIADYGFEAVTLRLANGLRYTPDWWTVNSAGQTTFYEVKGGYIREDAIAKLKMAATQFRNYTFLLCVWSKGEWFIEQVLP